MKGPFFFFANISIISIEIGGEEMELLAILAIVAIVIFMKKSE